MSITKEDMVHSIQNRLGLSKRKSIDLVNSLLEIIKKTLENGEGVLISRFGKFCVRHQNERRGRKPQTGNDMALGEQRVVIFKCSEVLRDRLNGVK
jgi:integration host factor subunit alpha